MQEEWEAGLGIFPGLVVVLIFFGVFDASVAQASSEGWFGRVPDPRLRYFPCRARLCDDVSGRLQFAIEGRSTLLHLLHAPNARGRRARELSVEALSTAALTGIGRAAAAHEPSDLSRASLHNNARATQGTPRVTASSAPKPIAARSTA